ncbi:MAG TPA: PAS domain S-box protein, partial [Acidimicrobiia bacterium]|nr:PAS domain S-box protein [Acidimicrobiia bacterium]
MAFQRSTSDESGDRSPADALAAAVRQAHEDAPNPAGIVALDGTLVWMNAAARTLAPVPDPGVTGQRVDALLTPDEAVLTRAILADLVAGTGDGRTFETRFRRTDGSNVWLLVDVWLVRDPEGAPAFVIFEAHDIDDRRRDQEAQADAGRRMRSAFDDAPTGIAVTTLDGAYVEVNGALAHVLGRSRSDLLRLRWQDVTHPDDLGVSTAFAEEAIVRGRGYSVEKRYLRPDGTTVWAQVHVSVVTDRAGRPSHLVANVHDVTRRRQIEASLRASEERFRFLASSSPLGILLVDSQAGCVYANDRFSDLTGVAPQHAKGDGWFAMVAADARAGVEERWREALVTRAEVDVEMPAADGVRWLRLRARPTRSLDDTLSYVATVEDVTEMVRATREAKDVRSLLQAIVESTTDLVALARADGRLVQVNAAGRRLMDIGSEDRLEDHMVFDFFTEDARRIIEEEVVPHLRLHDVWEGELTMRSLDGREIPMSHVAHVHRSPDGRAEWLSTIARDISERKAFEQFLAHQALHDPLTGLANRALFFDRITLATARLSRTDRPAAVLFLDLDRFKEINDTLGHGVGDWVLGVVAQRIRDAVRPADTVARLGGDEFGVLCEDLAGTEEAIAVAERLRELLTRPIELSDHQGVRGSVTPGASIGVAYLAPGADADAVTRDADAAMYHAKSQGRGRVEVFRPALRVRAGRRFAQEASLRRALEDGEIVPYYQPIVRADSGAVVGFEA